MTKKLLVLGALAGCVVLGACGSSSDTSDSGETGGTGGAKAGAFDKEKYRNNKAISEGQACAKISKAISSRASDLGCTVTTPTCPDYLRQAYPKEAGSTLNCSTWDEGIVSGCATFVSTLSCTELNTRPCDLVYFEKTGTGDVGACSNEGGAGAAGSGGASGSAGAGGSTAGAGGSTAGAGGSTAGAGGAAAGAAGEAGAGGSAAGAAGEAGAGGSAAGAAGEAGAGGSAGAAGEGGAGGSAAGAAGEAGAAGSAGAG